jgi:hypothetical protein
MTVRDGVDVFYYTQPVDSDDQASSLADYLTRHGFLACKTGNDEVMVPLECANRGQAGAQAADVHMLIGCWRLFWEHSDAGVFDLPIYQKD